MCGLVLLSEEWTFKGIEPKTITGSKCQSTDLVPLRGKNYSLDHAQKTEFWYLLGVLFNIPNDHTVTFIWEPPPPPLGGDAGGGRESVITGTEKKVFIRWQEVVGRGNYCIILGYFSKQKIYSTISFFLSRYTCI